MHPSYGLAGVAGGIAIILATTGAWLAAVIVLAVYGALLLTFVR